MKSSALLGAICARELLDGGLWAKCTDSMRLVGPHLLVGATDRTIVLGAGPLIP